MSFKNNTDVINIMEQLSPNSYIVGGAVRDMLMGQVPHDIDITTDILPNELMKIFPTANEIGSKFGTIIVQIPSGTVDITTMRRDITLGIHPNVEFTTNLREDLARRDLTVNAMAMTIDGNLIDYYGGEKDIQYKLLRAVGNPIDRVQHEDPRRTIRVARLATQLNFRIADDLRHAIIDTDITDIDGDFIRTELLKGLQYNSARMVEVLVDLNLMSKIIPEVLVLKHCEHNLKHHPEGGAYDHTLRALQYCCDATVNQKVAILLHDIGKISTGVGVTYHGHAKVGVHIAKNILKRLKFSNAAQSEILFCIENHMKMHEIEQMRKAKRYALYDNKYFKSLMIVHTADCVERINMIDFINSDIPIRMPTPLLNGHDLMELGHQADNTLGVMLKYLYNIQVENNITNKETLLQYL